jgi:phage tail-like protein
MASFGRLEIEGPANRAYKHEHLIVSGPNRIGRVSRADGHGEAAKAAELVLPDDVVSADHALITAVVTGCYITDMGSRKGTTVRGKALPQQTSRLLRDGDEIVIGPFRLCYRQSVTLAERTAWRSSAPVLRPEAAARQWQVERQRQMRPSSDMALFQRERKELRHAPSEFLQYLPWIYQESDLINELLLSFQMTWQSIDEVVDAIHWYSHPMLAPEGLLDWLASWFDVVLDASWPIDRQRAAISRAVELFQWRGTAHGLKESITLLTGLPVDIVEPGQEARVNPTLTPALEPHEFCVVVRPPKPGPVNVRALRRIIEHGQPAYTSCRLSIVPLRSSRRTTINRASTP